MHEKAHIVFGLINEMFILEAKEAQESLKIAMFPHLPKNQKEKIINDYRRSSRDIVELLENDTDYSGIETLKQVLN